MPWMTIGGIVLGCVGVILFYVWFSGVRLDNQLSYTAVQSSDVERGLQLTMQDDTIRSDDHQDREK